MYRIIESIHGVAIEEYECKDDAIEAYNELVDPNTFDPYYDNLVEAGGYLRIEDEDGNGILNC